MVSIQEVSFGYSKDNNNLTSINLEVKQGECVLLCGESGCGKSTVIKLVNGLIPHFHQGCPFQGKVTADGMSISNTELYEVAKHVGSVFQNPKSQFFNLDFESELAFGLENQGEPREYIQQRMDETITSMEIQNLAGRGIFAMSGGEKQILAFASVYAMNPDIYVLDEPTANLDADAIERLKHQIKLLKASGKTILIAEHRLYFLTELIDRAVYIREGKVLHNFTSEEFRNLPDKERKKLGLRSLSETTALLPTVGLDCNFQGLMVENLACGFGKESAVFQDLSFSLLPGQVLAITGHNGAGKTTLGRCLCGLIKEKSGSIKLKGSNLSLKQRQRVAFCVMQDVNHQLFSDSVWGECELAASSTGDAGDNHAHSIEEVLATFHLLSFRDKHPMALSGGQKQRLAVATAILSDKELLIFDEPTSGLDYAQMQNVTDMVRSLANRGKIIVVISHDKEFLASACDRVLNLNDR